MERILIGIVMTLFYISYTLQNSKYYGKTRLLLLKSLTTHN